LLVKISKIGLFTTRHYLCKDTNSSIDRGTFNWNTTGSEITINSTSSEVQVYKVGENILFHLDKNGNIIKGNLSKNYQLHKIN
jgi:uncharacterized lipoprotein NlpE involved in copper resistance